MGVVVATSWGKAVVALGSMVAWPGVLIEVASAGIDSSDSVGSATVCVKLLPSTIGVSAGVFAGE